jgi:hypothetical protein
MPMIQVIPSADLVAPFATVSAPLVAFQIDDQEYWHLELYLLFGNDIVLRVTGESRCPAPDCPYLECFTPVIENGSKPVAAMRSIEPPFHIVELLLLRREEWVVSAPEMEGETIGNNPRVLMSGPPGSMPANGVAVAVVTAGVLLASDDGRRIAVVTSERVALNIDFIQEARLVTALLATHSADSVWRVTSPGYGGV